MLFKTSGAIVAQHVVRHRDEQHKYKGDATSCHVDHSDVTKTSLFG